MQAWGFLKNRTVVAALGAALIFGGGATVTMSQLAHHAAPAGQANTSGAAASAATTGAAATAATTTGASATATTAPTATTKPPTPTPQPPKPTPTSPTPGQPGQIQGTVASVSASAGSFTMRVGTTTFIVTVDANTNITINGQTETNLNNLSRGMNANVQGIWKTSNTMLASSVDAQGDN